MVRGRNTTCTPTRRPTQAYAACEGCLREHKSAFQVPTRMPTRANVEFKCRFALWQLQLENRNFSVQVQLWQLRLYDQKCSASENPTSVQGSGWPKRSTTQNALKAYANAYAGPMRSLPKDCRTNRRKALHTWQTVMICSTNAYAKSLREG